MNTTSNARVATTPPRVSGPVPTPARSTAPAAPRVGRNVPVVPLLSAALACRTDSERQLVAANTVVVGSSPEVDLARLAKLDAGLACRLAAYWESCGEMWDRFSEGEQGLVGLSVVRNLRRAAQTDSRAGRTDLVAEVEALCSLPVVGPFIDEILGSCPDLQTVQTRAAEVSLTVESAGDNASIIRFRLPARRPWPAVLGGAASRGEWEREFTMKVSWARWRDRRNRRLVSLTIDAHEIWAPQTAN